jgi:hypothetical protein
MGDRVSLTPRQDPADLDAVLHCFPGDAT